MNTRRHKIIKKNNKKKTLKKRDGQKWTTVFQKKNFSNKTPLLKKANANKKAIIFSARKLFGSIGESR
jgi:hypothetical protein